jgi:DNA-binding SARP family transcriptional activator
MFEGRNSPRGLDATVYRRVFDDLPSATLVLDSSGAVLAYNAAARELFGAALERAGLRCCDLVGCNRGSFERPLAHHCLTAAVLEHGSPLRELDFAFAGRRMEIAAAPLADGLGAVVEVWRAETSAPPVPAPLRITTLGGLTVWREGRDLGGDWLHHRPGQLLRYLICARGHRVPVDELVEALWPDSSRQGITSLRQAVHQLRERLEPGRPRHTHSTFVQARAGAYSLDMSAVIVDADEFETEANAALLTSDRATPAAATPQLERAAELYTGEFLADAPYADWALEERERLRAQAARVLRKLADLHLQDGEPLRAGDALQRLVELEPLDQEAHRDLIALMLQRGRHAEAARRYHVFRQRFRRAFESELDFSLAELLPGEGQSASTLSSRSVRTTPA